MLATVKVWTQRILMGIGALTVGTLVLAGIVAAFTSSNDSDTSTDTAAASTSEPTAIHTATPALTATQTPTPVPTLRPTSNGPARLVANTGGTGVSLRTECTDDARANGSIPEGSEVQVTGVGQGDCAGWSTVTHGEVESWVQNDFLVPTPTPEPTPTPLTAPLILEPGGGCTKSYGFITYEGLVTNNTAKSMEQVVAVASYFTADGTFVTSDEALIDYNPVLPGQSSPFSVISTDNPAISKCRVEFKEFFGGTIQSQRREP